NQFDLNVANSTYPVNLSEWHTIVVRTDYVPNANDNVTIYFDPDFSQPEVNQDPQNITHLAADASFDNIRLRCGNGTASATWTNIVLGTNSVQVGFAVPPITTFQNFTPAQNAAYALPGSAISVRAIFGAFSVSANAVTMTVDGNAVTPTFTANSSSLLISYQPVTALVPGSAHTVTVNLTDAGGQPATTTWSFTVDSYPTLPVNLVGPVSVNGGGVGTTIWSAQNNWLGSTFLNTNYAGTLYAKFSLEFDDVNGETGGGGAFGGLHFYNGGTEKLLIGNDWPSINWSYDAGNSGSGDIVPTPIVLGEWHTFVVKIAYVAGGLDNVSIWFDPDLSRTEAGQSAPTAFACDAAFDNVHVRAGNGSAMATYSNIVISAVSPFATIVTPAVLTLQGHQLSWTSSGVLQQAASLNGPWSDAPSQNNPQTLDLTNSAQFYRLRQ
ncbi:MAG TPA: hypothetical protein VF607_14860, partial [Verrucomicrobiae bacterium]